MNVLSLFDGISCGRLALNRAGIVVNNYFSSEIKPYAIRVADFNFPQDTNNRLGDVTKIKSNDLPSIDLLIGGSPCQDFSGANKERLGLHGTKSKLFFEFVRILEEKKPKYFLLENVRMKKEHEDFITNILGVNPIVINSSLVSAQLRHRLYWTNIPFSGTLENKNLRLNDVLTDGFSDRDKARALLESDSRPLTTPIKMVHRYFNTGFTTLIFKNRDHYETIKHHFDINFKGKSAKYIDNYSGDLSIYNGVRYLNKTEKERLQTLPDGYTSIISEKEASCVLGDGWTVDVLANIFRCII